VGRTITALVAQKRHKDRVNVFLDGEFAFGLPLDEAHQLAKGQVLSDDDIAQLRTIDEVARAFDRAVTLLARRPYSTSEIRRKLASKEIDPAIIDQALAKLERFGYVDDRAFAQYWIENRERFRPRGSRALKHELRAKGLPHNIIEEALEGVDTADSAYRAAQEHTKRLRGLTTREARAKLGAFLARRGFNYDIIRETTERILTELEEAETGFLVPDDADDDLS